MSKKIKTSTFKDMASLPKDSPPGKLSPEFSQTHDSSFGEAQPQTQAVHPIARIEDPLWRHICSEALKMIGSSAEHIWQAKLGPFSPKDTTIDLYCHTAEIARLIQQYDFIILESIRQYFPTIKELRVEIN